MNAKHIQIVLKLAQASLFYETKEETPVILLDDVMGELDEKRQKLVYEIIQNMQIFLTSCQPESIGQEQTGKGTVFYMENGELKY